METIFGRAFSFKLENRIMRKFKSAVSCQKHKHDLPDWSFGDFALLRCPGDKTSIEGHWNSLTDAKEGDREKLLVSKCVEFDKEIGVIGEPSLLAKAITTFLKVLFTSEKYYKCQNQSTWCIIDGSTASFTRTHYFM